MLIGAGRNSGYLPSSLGFPETARRLAEANLADLHASQASTLLTLNPGDAYAFRQLYDERLGIDCPGRRRGQGSDDAAGRARWTRRH